MKKFLIINIFVSLAIFSEDYKTIETKTSKVIFEKSLEKQAIESANLIENLNSYYLKKGIIKEIPQIPVIMKRGNNFPMAYFIPKTLNFLGNAPMNTAVGTNPWIETLNVHEYRHYIQFLISGLGAVPTWALEGDAIYYETKLGENGRGRTPGFLKDYRAILNEGEVFSYAKAKNGSYKDLVPTQYHLGYLLTMYGYEKYGEKFWDEVFAEVKSFHKNGSFSHILEKKTGLNAEEFYKKALEYYKDYFRQEKTCDYVDVLLKDEKGSNHYFAYEYKDSQISLKNSLNETDSFYVLKDGKEEKITDTGYLLDPYFEVKGNKIIWSELTWDKTNPTVNFYDVQIYDMEKREKTKITKEKYYYSPSLSKDGDKIALIKHDGVKDTEIHMLNTKGEVIKVLNNDKGYFYNYVKWNKNDESLIVSLRDNKGKMGIVEIDLKDEKTETILDFDNCIVGPVFINEDNIYFSGSFGLVENIYKIDLNTKKMTQVTESNIGTNAVTVANNKLYFSEYGKEGYKLKVLEQFEGKEFTKGSLKTDEKINFESIKNNDLIISEKSEKQEYEIKDYKKHKYTGYGTLVLVNTNEDKSTLKMNARNPRDDFKAENIIEKNAHKGKSSVFVESKVKIPYSMLTANYEHLLDGESEEKNVGLKLSFPLNLSKNSYLRYLNLDFGYISPIKGDKNSFLIEGTFVNSKFKAIKDIDSENSQGLNIYYEKNVDDSKNNKLTLDFDMKYRGFFENDGISYSFVYDRNNGDFKNSNRDVMSSGYLLKNYDFATKNTITYQFPICYPDAGAFAIYMNRIKGKLFYENALLDGSNEYSTAGGKLTLETQLFNSPINANLNLQYNYLIEEKKSDIVVGVSFVF